jgi:Transport and Golgi organisation 2
MCTAVLSILAGQPVLLAGIRDELTGRAWLPPARHWPGYPGLIGGLDLQAGGTWLAVAPEAGRVACVLNGRGRAAPQRSRRSRGSLPLQAAAQGKPDGVAFADFDPFHLISAEPGRAVLWSWNGDQLTERELGPGLHLVVNSGLDSDLTGAWPPHERARVEYFGPLLRAAPRPAARPGEPVRRAWADWLPLIDGDGIGPQDQRALVVRHDLGDGRVFASTSVSLVALSAGGLRYDFNGRPGDASAWYPVPLAEDKPGPA